MATSIVIILLGQFDDNLALVEFLFKQMTNNSFDPSDISYGVLILPLIARTSYGLEAFIVS